MVFIIFEIGLKIILPIVFDIDKGEMGPLGQR